MFCKAQLCTFNALYNFSAPTPAFPDDTMAKSQMRLHLAVCVKGLFFPDPSVVPRLVEWLELQFILGVEKIFLYHIMLPPEALAMLRHYERRGLVVLKEFVWAGPYLRYAIAIKSDDFPFQ